MSAPVFVYRWWVVLSSVPSRFIAPADRGFMLATEREPFESFTDLTDFLAGSNVAAVVSFDMVTPGSRTRAGWVDERGFFHGEASTPRDGDQLVAALRASFGDRLGVIPRVVHGETTEAALWLVTESTHPDQPRARQKRIGTVEFGW